MKKVAKWTVGVLVVTFLVIQVVQIDRTNPPVETEVPAATNVRAVLRRACYDCHSNETVWPSYSRIAPVSWLIARDVREGREALNFSTWNRLGMKKRLEVMHKSWEEVAEGEMPPWLYLPPHPDARLSEDDRALLRAWSLSAASEDTDQTDSSRRSLRRQNLKGIRIYQPVTQIQSFLFPKTNEQEGRSPEFW